MSIVSQHLQNIIGQSETTLWGGYVNMLKQLKSEFASPKHWVLEFLQNSEDAFSKRISIRLEQDSLQILNDGDAFSNEDFKTICDVNSRKLPSLGFFGYIGIGFKSIFSITDCINIQSGDFHFRFDKEYWDDVKRDNAKFSEWPWEILPIENHPVELQEGYTTGFFVQLENKKGQDMVEEIEKFLESSNFPQEAILLLKNIEVIEVQTQNLSFTITKKTEKSDTIPIGKKEHIILRKQINGQQYPEESYYLIFRKTVRTPNEIQKDEETERVRRSDILEREIGLVFGSDSENNLTNLSGKIAGVYSFLPVEGEQTGLPFGIFGDFIPKPGRDMINYGAKWNHWMLYEVTEFFKEVVYGVFLHHPSWMSFPVDLLEKVQYSSTYGPGKEFWEEGLRNPIKAFFDSEALYPDDDGNFHKLDELIKVDEEIAKLIGKDTIEKTLQKKIVHPSVQSKIGSRIESINNTYDFIHNKKLLETQRSESKNLMEVYKKPLSDYYIKGRKDKRGISRDTPLPGVPCVLADDGELYPPNQMFTMAIDLSHLPNFLMETIPKDKKPLHPEIAKDADAIEQLARFGVDVVSEQRVISYLEELINRIKVPEDCPKSWKYPDDLIEATLFLISKPNSSYISLRKLVAYDGALHATQNLFVTGTDFDWTPLWDARLLPGFQPINEKYFDMDLEKRYGLNHNQIFDFFHNIPVHGFDAETDKQLIEKAATAKAIQELTKDGHIIDSVEDRDRLGYDLQCQHCAKVFEVKGMGKPYNVILPESEVNRAKEKKDDYILICVYNLPTEPNGVGYMEIPNPMSIWDPVGEARVPKDRWLRI